MFNSGGNGEASKVVTAQKQSKTVRCSPTWQKRPYLLHLYENLHPVRASHDRQQSSSPSLHHRAIETQYALAPIYSPMIYSKDIIHRTHDRPWPFHYLNQPFCRTVSEKSDPVSGIRRVGPPFTPNGVRVYHMVWHVTWKTHSFIQFYTRIL